MRVVLRAGQGALGVFATCDRCRRERVTRLAFRELGDVVESGAVTRLLPTTAATGVIGNAPDGALCQIDPSWEPALQKVWSQALIGCLRTSKPAELSGTLRVAPEVRRMVFRASVDDPTGWVRGLLEERPLLVALLASADARRKRLPGADTAPAWRKRVERMAVDDVVAWVARQHGVTDPAAWKRLGRLLRHAPGDASPEQLVQAARLPFAPSDVPKDPNELFDWLEALALLAATLPEERRPGPVLAVATLYVSRHHRALIDKLRERRWAGEWLDWMVVAGRRPSRLVPPERMLADMDRWARARLPL